MSRIRFSILYIGLVSWASSGALATADCLIGPWWPPQVVVVPDEPEMGENVSVTMFGIWPDTCAPNESAQHPGENDLQFDVILGFDICDRFCGDQPTEWSLTEVVQPPEPGPYVICAVLFDPACTQAPCTPCETVARITVYCPGDLDGDRRADLADLAALLAHFGTEVTSRAEGDLDDDGVVDLDDLARFLGSFGRIC